MQRIPELPPRAVARCVRCGAALRHARPGGLPAAVACTIGAAFLFPFALFLPLIDLQDLGRFSASTLFTRPDRMRYLATRRRRHAVLPVRAAIAPPKAP